MRHFGNFLVKQAVDLKKSLMMSWDKETEGAFYDSSERMESRLHYLIALNKMDLQELKKHATTIGVKIPCPANY